jgi:hypothetical protein
MSDVTELLLESITGLLQRYCRDDSLARSEQFGWAADLWTELERAELTRIGVPEELGGGGGDLQDAAAVVRAAAFSCAAVPLAETALLAGWLLGEAGMTLPPGPLTAAVLRDGRAAGVPYARQAAAVAVLAETDGRWGVAVLTPDDYELAFGVNLSALVSSGLAAPWPGRSSWRARSTGYSSLRFDTPENASSSARS